MYEESKRAMIGPQMSSAMTSRDDRTIGENIDARIAEMGREIERLKETKKKLASGTALTDMKPSELRRAMDS